MKKFGLMLLHLGIVVGVYAVVIYWVTFVWYRYLTQIEMLKPITDLDFGVGIIASDIITLVLYFYIYKLIFRKNIFTASNMSAPSMKTTGIIVILSIFMGIWMMSIVRIPWVEEQFPQFEEAFDFLLGHNVVFFVIFWLVHAFNKEIFYRGLIFNSLRSAMPIWISIIVLGVIYGKLYFNWDLALSAYGMLGAIILSLIYIWQRSIWTTIISEFVLFSTYYVIYLWDPAFGGLLIAGIVVSTLAIPYLMYVLWKTRITEPSAAQSGKRSSARETQSV